MWYRLVADAAMVAHFAFLAYLAVGGFLAWRWPRTIVLHVAVALYGLGNAAIGWPCPLTGLEDWGRTRAGGAGLPTSGFIDHYLTGVVYPSEHEVLVQVLVAVVVVSSWVGFALRRGRPPSAAPSGPAARASSEGAGRGHRPSAGAPG